MKNWYDFSVTSLLIIFLFSACVQSNNSRTIFEPVIANASIPPTPTLIPTLITVNADYKVDIRSCPFLECEIIGYVTSHDFIEAIEYTGNLSDTSPKIWLKIRYGHESAGWIYLNQEKISVQKGLFEYIPTIEVAKPSPTPLPTDTPFININLCRSNINDPRNPIPGKTVRFKTPIQINPNGDDTVILAIEKYEKFTNGAITFEVVDFDPSTGIIVTSGDGWDGGGSPGCGNVTTGISSKSGHRFNATSDGIIKGLVYVHLGSEACNHKTVNGTASRSAITEHEIAHAIGIGEHFDGINYPQDLFDGFNGNEGLSESLLLIVNALYTLPPGTDMKSECASVK